MLRIVLSEFQVGEGGGVGIILIPRQNSLMNAFYTVIPLHLHSNVYSFCLILAFDH